MIQKRVLTKIQDFLQNNYGIDRYSGDSRLSFCLYYCYMQEIIDTPQIRKLVFNSYEMFQENIDCTRLSFERSIYRALERIVNIKKVEKSRVHILMELLQELGEL